MLGNSKGMTVLLELSAISHLQMKQVKFYTVKDVIIAASEFYYMEEDDLSFQIKLALNSLIAAKVNYKKLDK